MIATLRPLTYDDLLQMPDDGQHYEIIAGELVVTPSPSWNHQRVLGEIYRLIDDFARQSGEGKVVFAPFDVVLGPHDIVEPDLVFMASAQGSVLGEQHFFQGAPHLLVEVISPSSRQSDNVKKLALYARAGVLDRRSCSANADHQRLGGRNIHSDPARCRRLVLFAGTPRDAR